MTSLVKVPCLGRPFNLGMLYNAHSDSIIPGKSLWDSKTLKSASQSAPQPSSSFDIVAEDTISKKSSSLDVEANLKLSLLGGMVNVSGAAKYLDDKKSSEQQARVTLKYSSTTHFEQLTMEQLSDIQHPQILEDNHATHVVTGILFGSDAFFIFDRALNSNEKLRSIHGNVEAQIKMIPIQGSASLDMKKVDKTETQKLQCTFYGDVIVPSPPSTFEEAVKVYKDLPRLLENKSVPKIAYLHPLSDLDGKPSQIVRWITVDLISKVEEIMESLHKMEMRTTDLMKHEICSKFVDIENQLSKLLMLIKRFQLNFSKDLAQLLPKIRSSGAKESELAVLISSVHASPFNFKEMERYLQGKNREVQQLAQVIKNASKDSRVQCAFPDSECSLTTLTMDDDIEQVICFALNVTTDTSPYIENLEEYLQTKKCRPKASKEWYDSPAITKMMRQKSKQFTQIIQTKINSKNMAFVVTDHNEETDSTDPTIIRYTNGVPESLEAPGKPGKPSAENISTNSIDLRWTEPAEGAEYIESYRVLYRLSEGDQTMHTIDTIDQQLWLHVKNLLPGTRYQFSVQAVRDPIASIESDHCYVSTEKVKRLAEIIVKQSQKITTAKPSVYGLPLSVTYTDKVSGLHKYSVGKPKANKAFASKPERVLMVVGATGAGKSTLIDGVANYVMGVTWKDNYRFKVVFDEGKRSQAESQTRDISSYTFHSLDMPYDLTIVDTPGFGDTGGIKRDKEIAAKIKQFFSGARQGGIDFLHGIGFVAQASLPRLTPTQKYIFNAVLSIFGKDIVDNIFLLVTFADATEPPVLAATKAADIPYKHSFSFNNSALFASNEAASTSTGLMFNSMFWEMGYSSFKSFFQHFSEAECHSLIQTRAVLKEREQLENLVPKMQEQVKIGLTQLDKITQEEKIIQQHEQDILANKDFNYMY